MAIITVTGTIEREAAGIVLPHEHVFIDLTNQYRPFPEATKSSWSCDKVGLDNRDVLSRNPLALRDNMILDDIDCAEREVLEFKRAGGRTIVDASSKRYLSQIALAPLRRLGMRSRDHQRDPPCCGSTD